MEETSEDSIDDDSPGRTRRLGGLHPGSGRDMYNTATTFTLTVMANALFCSQTAWHIGDVAVPEWSLAGKH